MMFAWWIVSQGPSTEYPPRCTIATTPLVIFIASPNFEMSARTNCSSSDGFKLLLSEWRSVYFPASSLRRCDPTWPAAPVMSTVFIDCFSVFGFFPRSGSAGVVLSDSRRRTRRSQRRRGKYEASGLVTPPGSMGSCHGGRRGHGSRGRAAPPAGALACAEGSPGPARDAERAYGH